MKSSGCVPSRLGGEGGQAGAVRSLKSFKFELDDKAIMELKFKKLTLCSRSGPGREQAKAGGGSHPTTFQRRPFSEPATHRIPKCRLNTV